MTARALLYLSFAALACSAVPTEARIGIDAPSRASFDPVGLYLDHRCGSLDCHGSAYRNLRVYGTEGLRLDPKDVPGGKPTTSAELDATYRSLVALEPAVMSYVVDEKASADVLTFIRKARGTESHKGGALVTIGDDQDRCMVTWLAGKVDADACARALMVP
jgi:hypothetical protein